MSEYIRHSREHIKEIDNEPFGEDILGRKKFANLLTNIATNFSTGFVMSLNGAWGSGKSVFLEQWYKQLTKDGYRVTIFNAWENDYFSEPTLAILSQFRCFFDNDRPITEKALSIWETLQVVPQSAIKGFVKKQVSDKIGEESIKEITEKLTAASEQNLFYKNSDIAKYVVERTDFIKYRTALMNFAKEVTADTGKPLIFIIDELDRCTPTYAVEVLEKIKHLFNIPNIVFCIAVDKEQLRQTIQGFYGSYKFNGEEYLRRFFDVEFDLPPIKYLEFAELLSNHFDFNSCIRSNNNKNEFIKISADMAEKQHLSLRQVEKYFAYAKLVFSSYTHLDNSEWIIAIMIIVHKFDNELFKALIDKSNSLYDYAIMFKPLFDFSEYSKGPNNLGALLYYIDVYLHPDNMVSVPDDFKFTWTSDFSESDLDKMSRCYIAAYRREYEAIPLAKILNKILLIEQFVSRI